MTRRAGGYKLVDGTVVATSGAGFFSQAHLAGINLDEKGNTVAGMRVWTGTNGTGTEFEDNCNDWTKAFGNIPTIGLTDGTDSSWAHTNLSSECDGMFAFYCVQQ
jgi:hypothetical protein